MVKKLKSPRRLAALAVFAIVAMSAFGFAAGNTFQGQNRAGNGEDAISGFTISDIHYSIQNNNGDFLDEVRFTLNQPASEVFVRFNGGSYVNCNLGAPTTSVVCALPADSVNIELVDELEVSAVS